MALAPQSQPFMPGQAMTAGNNFAGQGTSPDTGTSDIRPGYGTIAPGGYNPNGMTRYAAGQRMPGGNATGGPLQYTGGPLQAPPPQVGTGAPASGPISTNPLQPTAGEIAGTGPANIQQFGGTPSINPTYAQAAQMDPNQNLAYMQYYGQLLNTGLQPQFQSQNQTLADQLAARGITNSGSGQYLTNQLMGQQAGALAQGLQPIVSQGYGYTQQDLANNAGYLQAANMANAGASNEANVLNAQLYNQDRYANYGAYNQFQNQLLGLGSGQLSADQAAYLNSFGPSTGVESAYGSALQGQQNAYTNTYSNALAAQQQQMQEAAMLAAAG